MNKLLKGAIAGAAGVALLLGGAGTFALWNSDATVTGGTIVAGDLKVTPATGVGTWSSKVGTSGTSSTVSVISDYRIVPGDVLTYTKTMNVTAVGNHLKATLDIVPGSIAASDGTKGADVALATFLENNAVVTASGTGIAAGTTPETFLITPGASSVTVTVTLSFPAGVIGGAENAAKLGSVNLSDVKVALNQTL